MLLSPASQNALQRRHLVCPIAQAEVPLDARRESTICCVPVSAHEHSHFYLYFQPLFALRSTQWCWLCGLSY